MLTKKQQIQIKASQEILGWFYQITMRYSNPFDWNIHSDNIEFFDVILPSAVISLNLVQINILLNLRDDKIMSVTNTKKHRGVYISYAQTGFTRNYVTIDHTSKEHDEYIPVLHIIFTDLTKKSFQDFELLFQKFISFDTDNDIEQFDLFVKEQYK